MPALSNPRHERFARALADGKSASAAYIEAGYSANRGAASRLQRDSSVVKRVAAFHAEAAALAQEATTLAAERLSIDREWIMARLVSNATKAAQGGDYGPSNKALELLGKELGMFVDRAEVTNLNYDVSDEPASPDEWAEQHVTAH